MRKATHYLLQKVVPINEDKFGSPLQQGDQVIVCYDKNGYLWKATIVGEKGRQWVIQIDDWDSTKKIDKNPARMVKYNG